MKLSALTGIKVVDLSQAIQGPVAAVMLGDMGADVIKVESRAGDVGRGATNKRLKGQDASGSGVARAALMGAHRNKRSLALSLNKPEGIKVLFKLLKQADVMIHTFRPSTIKRLGLEYEDVARFNPKIIYAGASGYGQEGPDAEQQSFDILTQAYTGLMEFNGPVGGPPRPLNPPVFDVGGGVMLAYGIMVALFARDRIGKGQKVDSSLLGTALHLQSWEINYTLIEGELPPRDPRGMGFIGGLYMIFEAKDGWITIAGVGPGRWHDFCRAMGIEHLEKDPRFSSSNDRVANRPELVKILDEVFATKPVSEWMERLRENHQIATPVKNYLDVIANPQPYANGYITEFNDQFLGPTRLVGPVVKLSETPGAVRSLCPEIGQHTNDILLELGYSWEQIGELTADEVVGFEG